MNTNLPYVNDYTLNRDTFNADSSTYIPRYVERLSDEESFPDFQQRLRQTPSPTHARQFAQRILGAFAAAMAYVVRYGVAVDKLEAGRGVDNCGSTIAEYVQSLAIEVTINGRVGVAVDRVIPLTANGRPNPLKPYLVTVQAENLTSWEYAGPNSASVLETVEYNQCVGEETNRAVRWYMDEATGHAFYQVGKDAPVDSMLPAIPFVVIEGNGAIPSIAQHQRLLANLLSIAGSESPGLLQTFLVRARDAFNNGAHSRGVDDEVQVGKSRGLWYGKGEDAPAFVGQPAAPAAEARAWVQQLVNDMESLAGAGDTTLAATAAALGATIARAERQLWAAIDMFTADHTRTIRYPLSFAAQLQTERQAYIAALFENAQRASGRAGMESASVFVAEESNAGRSSAVVQAAVNAVKSAACLLNDEKSIISAFEAGAIDSESVADALGCKAGVAAKAKAERIEKAQNLAAAAAAAAAIKQGDNTVGGVGSDRTAELASKEISQSEPGTTRGENK